MHSATAETRVMRRISEGRKTHVTSPRTGRISRFVTVVVLLLSARALQAQTIQGRVVDAESGEGIAGAGVLVIAGERLIGTAITGSTGLYALRIPETAGPLLLRASRQGYRTASLDSVTVPSGETVEVADILLQPSPIVLDEVRAEVRRSRLTPGREWIRQNQLLGKGTFFSGAMLRQLDPLSLTRYIADQVDLWVEYDGRGNPSFKNPFAFDPCVVVMLNRWPIYQTFDIDDFSDTAGWPSMDEIPIEAIAAVEVYNDLRQLPPMLYFTHRGDAQTCGVVNIWTWDAY